MRKVDRHDSTRSLENIRPVRIVKKSSGVTREQGCGRVKRAERERAERGVAKMVRRRGTGLLRHLGCLGGDQESTTLKKEELGIGRRVRERGATGRLRTSPLTSQTSSCEGGKVRRS